MGRVKKERAREPTMSPSYSCMCIVYRLTVYYPILFHPFPPSPPLLSPLPLLSRILPNLFPKPSPLSPQGVVLIDPRHWHIYADHVSHRLVRNELHRTNQHGRARTTKRVRRREEKREEERNNTRCVRCAVCGVELRANTGVTSPSVPLLRPLGTTSSSPVSFWSSWSCLSAIKSRGGAINSRTGERVKG